MESILISLYNILKAFIKTYGLYALLLWFYFVFSEKFVTNVLYITKEKFSKKSLYNQYIYLETFLTLYINILCIFLLIPLSIATVNIKTTYLNQNSVSYTLLFMIFYICIFLGLIYLTNTIHVYFKYKRLQKSYNLIDTDLYRFLQMCNKLKDLERLANKNPAIKTIYKDVLEHENMYVLSKMSNRHDVLVVLATMDFLKITEIRLEKYSKNYVHIPIELINDKDELITFFNYLNEFKRIILKNQFSDS